MRIKRIDFNDRVLTDARGAELIQARWGHLVDDIRGEREWEGC